MLQIKCSNLSEHSYLYLLMFNCMKQNDILTQLFHQCFLFGKLLKQYISNMAPNNSCILTIYGLIRPCNRLLSQVAVTLTWALWLKVTGAKSSRTRLRGQARPRPAMFKAKAKATGLRGRGQGQGRNFLSSSCPRGRGQSSRTPSLGSVATQLRYGGKHDKCFIANFLLSP